MSPITTLTDLTKHDSPGIERFVDAALPPYHPQQLLSATSTDAPASWPISITTDVEDISVPSSVPESDAEAAVALANTILSYALQDPDLGHHRCVGDALIEWVKEYPRRGDAFLPEAYWKQPWKHGTREITLMQLTPTDAEHEDAAGDAAITPTLSMVKKAIVIITWAFKDAPSIAAQAIHDQLRNWRQAWEKALAIRNRQEAAASILFDPPMECNGWRLIESPSNAIAYAGPAVTQQDDRLVDLTDAERADKSSRPNPSLGAVITVFESDGYLRAFSLPADLYHSEGFSSVERFEYSDLVSEKRHRLGNPDTWTDGAELLIEQMIDIDAKDVTITSVETLQYSSTPAAPKRETPPAALDSIVEKYPRVTEPAPTSHGSEDHAADPEKQQTSLAGF